MFGEEGDWAEQLVAGTPVEVELPLSMTDEHGAQMARVEFTVVIKLRRKDVVAATGATAVAPRL